MSNFKENSFKYLLMAIFAITIFFVFPTAPVAEAHHLDVTTTCNSITFKYRDYLVFNKGRQRPDFGISSISYRGQTMFGYWWPIYGDRGGTPYQQVTLSSSQVNILPNTKYVFKVGTAGPGTSGCDTISCWMAPTLGHRVQMQNSPAYVEETVEVKTTCKPGVQLRSNVLKPYPRGK